MAQLPIIDITPWLDRDHTHINESKRQVAEQLHSACLNYGFFYLRFTSFVDQEEPDELIKLAREFFALPQEEKDKISLRNEDNVRGYARLKENVTNGKEDVHEGLDLYSPVDKPDKTKPLWGENQWPTVPSFRSKYVQWIEKMKTLGMAVMEAMSVGLGMTPDEWQELRSQIVNTFWVMRVIGYPPLPDDHDGFSCGAHKDYGCLTFLYTDPTPNALRVFIPASLVKANAISGETVPGGTWITANPIPGCFVCNIGEMWEVWSNGLYKSTLHRVVHKSQNYRVSIPFFYEANFDAEIKPLAAALRIQSASAHGKEKEEDWAVPPKKYEPVIYGEFLKKKVGVNFSEIKPPS